MNNPVSTPTLRLATADYDRVAALADGRVSVEGIDLDVQYLAPSETFYRMLSANEFDVSEMSLSTFLISRESAEQGWAWTAIPVFPQRTAFHTSIYVREDAGIQEPGDLKGKRFGLTEYQVTAAVWTRGTLQDDFGVAPSDVDWFIERSPDLSHGGETGFQAPSGVSLTSITGGKTLQSMLIDGELDAILPSPYPGMASRLNRTDEADLGAIAGVRRLFPDPWAEMVRYYQRHGFLHANHTIVVQDRHLEADPDLARRLFDAFCAAKSLAYEELQSVVRSSLLLGAVRLEQQRRVFGEDPFPYGFAANREALQTLARYSADQGLTAKPAAVESLFAPQTLDT